MKPIPTLQTHGPEETIRLGAALGELLRAGHVVGLVGELGAGKTCLVRGVTNGQDVDPAVYVSSPTFTLVNQYPGKISLVHMDFYRLSGPDDLTELGADSYFGGDCACLVEWFDRFPDDRPPRYLEVSLRVTGDSSRVFELEAVGSDHRRLASDWVKAWNE